MDKYKCAGAKKAANTDLSAPTGVDRDAVMGGVLNHLPKDTWLGGACVTSGFI